MLDIFALILIYQQGAPIELIKTIIKERDNYFDPVHQSDISLKTFNEGLDHLNNKQMQDLTIQLSSEKALNFYCKNYFYQEIEFRDIFLVNLTFAKTQQILLDKFQIYTKDDREFYKRISFIQDGDILNKNYEFFLTISKNWKKEEKEFKQAIIGGRYGNDWSEKTKNINIFLKERCQ